MMGQQASAGKVQVSVGFAAGADGAGVAYAAVRASDREWLIRVPFRTGRAGAVQGREIAYGALRAVAIAVLERHSDAVTFTVADESLATDLSERRVLPTALTIPYVALRCSLNRFRSVEVRNARTGAIGDLTARAVAEVSLNVAA